MGLQPHSLYSSCQLTLSALGCLGDRGVADCVDKNLGDVFGTLVSVIGPILGWLSLAIANLVPN